MWPLIKQFFTDETAFLRISRGLIVGGGAACAAVAHQLPAPWDLRIAVAGAAAAGVAVMFGAGEKNPKEQE